MTEDKKVIGAPQGFTLHINAARLSAGAGFVVAYAGGIISHAGTAQNTGGADHRCE